MGGSLDVTVERVVVLGAGAAGYTAAIYLARANLSPLVLDGSTAGSGRAEATTTAGQKNSPTDKMRTQATRWGARCIDGDIEAVDLTSTPVVVTLSGGSQLRCHCTILANGDGSTDGSADADAAKMPGVFAVNPGDDERSAGLAAAVDAERWLWSSGLVVDESFPDGTGPSSPSKTEVNPAKLDAAVRGMTPVDGETRGETPVAGAVGSSGGNEPDTEETFDPNRTSHVGQYALRRLYRESTRSALVVLYTADGCGPCGRLRPIIRRVVDEYADSVHFVEIDVDVDKDIAEGAGVLGTPCVHVFKARERVAVVSGVKMRSAYRKAIDSCLEVNAVAEP